MSDSNDLIALRSVIPADVLRNLDDRRRWDRLRTPCCPSCAAPAVPVQPDEARQR